MLLNKDVKGRVQAEVTLEHIKNWRKLFQREVSCLRLHH